MILSLSFFSLVLFQSSLSRLRVNQLTTCFLIQIPGVNSRINWSMKLKDIRRAAEPGQASLMVVHSTYHWCNMVQLYQARTGPETLVSHSCPSNSSPLIAVTPKSTRPRWFLQMLKMPCKPSKFLWHRNLSAGRIFELRAPGCTWSAVKPFRLIFERVSTRPG